MKQTTAAIAVVALLIIGALVLRGGNAAPSPTAAGGEPGGNVSLIDGKQVIEISVKGGYSPAQTAAKAGVPTVLRFTTNGAYDCSSSVRIPSMSISKKLPPTGSTDIDLGTPAAGDLAGTCSMGMYSFNINFQA
jgi:plastocyanin domain-containing protein